MRLDHLAIAAETLGDGVAWAEDKLGVAFLAGGKHERYGTHNRLLGLADGVYLEVIARDPNAASIGPRWFALDDFKGAPRLVNWICEPGKFDAYMIHGMEKVVMSRGNLTWDMGVPLDGSLPMGGGFPTVLNWHTDTPPGRMLAPSGCSLRRLTVTHPQAQDISAQLAGQLVDDRIVFTTGPVGLSADIDTPHGCVTL